MFFICLLLLFLSCYCFCPNDCSRKGICVYNQDLVGVCDCYAHWNATDGADCSKRSCPLGRAWSDQAIAENMAHLTVECSNRGTCNRENGACICDSPFEGISCNRLSCPNECSGRGKCISMRQRAEKLDVTYELWDSDMIYGCECFDGYEGYDCSLKSCEVGLEDPATSQNEVQALECICDACTGNLVILILETHVMLSPDDDTETVESKILKRTRALGIGITFTGGNTLCDVDGVELRIEFTHNPGNINDVTIVRNTLTASDLSPGVVQIFTSGVLTTNGFTTVDGTGTVLPCSGKGICNVNTGVCSCFDGYGSSNGANNPASGIAPNCGFELVAASSCPTGVNANSGIVECTGHGTCSSAFTCTCADGYVGVNCASMACPQGISWFDHPTATNEAHAMVECSNRGICDTLNGQCTCQEGFTGDACEKLECPGNNVCSNHGTCFSMESLALLGETEYGEAQPISYDLWDKSSIQGCYCDRDIYLGPFALSRSKFVGHDCASYSCPFGHNTDIINKVNEVQKMVCSASAGYLIFKFADKSSSAVPFDSTIRQLKTSFDELTVIPKQIIPKFVSTQIDNENICSGIEIHLQFRLPGNAPLFSASTSPDFVGSIVFEEIVQGTTTASECASLGLCDRSTGNCNCFEGHMSGDGSYDGMTQGEKGDCSALDIYGQTS